MLLLFTAAISKVEKAATLRLLLVERVKCPSFHSQFLDHFECTISALHWLRLLDKRLAQKCAIRNTPFGGALVGRLHLCFTLQKDGELARGGSPQVQRCIPVRLGEEDGRNIDSAVFISMYLWG